MNLDLSFAEAALVLPREFKLLKIYIIGAGGTGSFAAMAIARLVFELQRTGRKVELTIIDPDRVEQVNIPRSNFCAAEVGRFKAQTLATRVTLAWGLEVAHINEELDFEKHIEPNRNSYQEMSILVGCVDNHEARNEISRSLEKLNEFGSSNTPRAWWIDGGNGRFSGQVLIGSTFKRFAKNNLFTTKTICQKLPAPSVIHPELLENQEIKVNRRETSALSCPELVRLQEQSLNINGRVAIEISEMLTSFLLTNKLRRFACYFDLESGTSRSLYCTPKQIRTTLKEAADGAKGKKSGK